MSANRTSKSDPAAELAERMIRVLESQRLLGGDSYPPTLGRLGELCEIRASDPLLLKAVGKKDFKSRAVVAWGKDYSAPVLLADAEDLDAAVAEAAPALLLELLNRAKQTKTQALTAAKLKDKLTEKLKKPFKAAIERGMEERSLPGEVGWLRTGQSKLLFLLSAVESSTGSAPIGSNGQAGSTVKVHGHPSHAETPPQSALALPPSGPAAPDDHPRDFATSFREAFDRLDRQNRSTNFVRLLDLRRALPEFDRDRFDAGLRQLRLDDEFTLDSHDGRHGALTGPEREAGVREAGSLLVYVSRRS